MLLDGKDQEQREDIEGQLWADPAREARILAQLGRGPGEASPDGDDAVTVIEE
jgi:hypothetical protein